MKGLIGSSVVFLLFASGPLQAQWVKVPLPNIPRTPDGKPNLSSPAPRTSYGKADLSGVWNVDNKYVRDLAVDFPAGYVPFQPWAKTLFDQRKDGSHSREDNAAHCLPPGTPRINAAPFPWKLVPDADLHRDCLRELPLLATDLSRWPGDGGRCSAVVVRILHRQMGR